jgi:hypothetical protein
VCLRDTAERDEGLTPRVVGRHARADVVGDVRLNVRVELG